ncbi:MAG TPA: DNA-formamidopyrimidine glycosylase family protein [Bryobacteraceae bacterium]|nr:DNA-formamidopyrimidine glycosylase family protein [Bryobacteraceae bacterium]
MPEGDTIFRTARALGRALTGKPITGFLSTYPKLVRYNEDAPLAGQWVVSIESRGKWLLIEFSGGGILATHMLMNGSWHIYRPGQHWQQPRANMRIVLETADYLAVGFRVPVVEMHTSESLRRDRRIPGLEIDVLSGRFDAPAAMERLLARADEAVADVLLHQDVLAGVGNVFKSEVCFATGVHPYCKVAWLGKDEARALIAAAQKLIGSNVLEDSGGMMVTYGGRARRTTHESHPGASLWVYGRAGEPCRRCGERIRRRIQGPEARVTFWCPSCQRMPDGTDIDG